MYDALYLIRGLLIAFIIRGSSSFVPCAAPRPLHDSVRQHNRERLLKVIAVLKRSFPLDHSSPVLDRSRPFPTICQAPLSPSSDSCGEVSRRGGWTIKPRAERDGPAISAFRNYVATSLSLSLSLSSYRRTERERERDGDQDKRSLDRNGDGTRVECYLESSSG